jgi:hypothetical protein
MRHAAFQPLTDVGAQPREHRGIKDARGDGVDPDLPAGKVAGRYEGDAVDGRLRSGVRRPADLAIEGRHRRGELADGFRSAMPTRAPAALG